MAETVANDVLTVPKLKGNINSVDSAFIEGMAEGIKSEWKKATKKAPTKDQVAQIVEYLQGREISDKDEKDNAKEDKKNKSKKKKLLDANTKNIVKGKWFESVGTSIKRLGDKSGNWLKKILGMVLFMAFFDPKGTFLKSIIRFIFGILKMIVGIFVELIPVMWNIIVEVLPELLKEIISGIASIVFTLLDSLGKSLEKNYPTLAKIVFWVRDLFGPEGTVTEGAKTLANLAPYFILLLGAVKALSFVMGPFVKIFQFLKSAFLGLKAVLFVIGKIIVGIAGFLGAPVWLVGLIVAGVVALIALLYIYWDEVKAFFKWLWEGIKWLATKAWEGITWLGEVIWGWFKAIGEWYYDLVIKPIVDLFYMVVDFLKDLFKDGFGNAIKKVGRFLVNLFKSIFIDPVVKAWNFIKDVFSPIFDTITSVLDKVGGFLGPVIETLGKVLAPLKDTLFDLWDLLSNTIRKGWGALKNAFYYISDFASASMRYGIGSSEAKSRYVEVHRAAREKNIDWGKLEDIAKETDVNKANSMIDRLNDEERSFWKSLGDAQTRGELNRDAFILGEDSDKNNPAKEVAKWMALKAFQASPKKNTG